MSIKKKPQNVVEKTATPTATETKSAAAPKAAKKAPAARVKKAAATGFSSRRVWPD